jgi:isoleucyl-tRNA synthetase
VPDDRLTRLDRWILEEFSRLEQAVIAAYDASEFHVVYQQVSQFIAVELSSVYHDMVKDRLYTDAADSTRRRATQTVLYRLVTGLCHMLAPILAFTTDETWEFIPGVAAGESVHATDWEPSRFARPEAEQARWRVLFDLREKTLPELEKARQAKTIGKSLEAKLTLTGQGDRLPQDAAEIETLRELVNVSQLEVHRGEAEAVRVAVSPAAGRKCERCWRWETTIGADKAHETICGRCVEAIVGFAAKT